MTANAEAVDRRESPAHSNGRLIRSVALPSEHGAWSFLFEPIALGLLVAPSLVGFALGLGVVGAFLSHQPLKTVVKDRRAGRRAFRTIWAERFAAGYLALAAGGFGVVAAAHGWLALGVLIVAAPFAAAQLVWDAGNKSRALGAELCGAIALGAVGSAIAVAGGWSLVPALGLWLALAARSAPSVLYVRARLKLERKKPFARTPILAAHALALTVVGVAVGAGVLANAAAAATALLLARAIWGLSSVRRGHTPAAVGAQEVVVGLVFVALVAAGS